MKIAAIDIGSNSIKLLVAEADSSGLFVPIRREKQMVRLGHETLLRGHLSSEAIVRAIGAIGMMKAVSESCGAEKILAIATASIREADNSEQVIREVLQRTGIVIQVLSSIEEARLIGLAVARSSETSAASSFINIDIGGGSTELSLMKDGRAKALHSMKIGAVRLTEQFLLNDPPTPKEITILKREIERALERPLRELASKKWDMVSGTSGTILAIAAALQSYSFLDEESEANSASSWEIKIEDLKAFNKKIIPLRASERKRLVGISEQRAEIIIAGGQILEAVLSGLKAKQLTTCNWSLREGVIFDRIADFVGRTRSSAKEHDPRMAGAEALGRKFQFEENHGQQVAKLSLSLFDQLEPLHKLRSRERGLLAAAALLHDVGYAISHESHHKHSLYIILNSELTGFTDMERLIIANIARYHRKSLPKPSHSQFMALSESHRELVWKLGGIVRFADSLDRSHQNLVDDVELDVQKSSLSVILKAPKGCDHEIWAAESKKAMLEQALGREVCMAVG